MDQDRTATCSGAQVHPTAASLAEEYGVLYDQIMAWFCGDGYGMGDIMLALRTSQASGTPAGELLALKSELGGWGLVWQELGLIGPAAGPPEGQEAPHKASPPEESGPPDEAGPRDEAGPPEEAGPNGEPGPNDEGGSPGNGGSPGEGEPPQDPGSPEVGGQPTGQPGNGSGGRP